jgi:cysteinyl-tRNA synthetase
VEPVRRGQLRIGACGPAAGRPAHLGDLRAVLLADLIRRTAERRRLMILASLSTSDGGGGEDHERAFRADCAALGARPPEFTTWHELGDVIDIGIGPAGQGVPQHGAETASGPAAGHPAVRLWAGSGPLLFEGREPDGSTTGPDGSTTGPDGPGAPVTLAELRRRGLDPLALRLAFLECRYRDPLDLDWPALAGSDAVLRRWRGQVAQWATHPSRPLSAEHSAQVTAAFEDDLDTPAALAALRALDSDAGVAPGARFETLAHVDQLLGLDLVSDVGKAPLPPPDPS